MRRRKNARYVPCEDLIKNRFNKKLDVLFDNLQIKLLALSQCIDNFKSGFRGLAHVAMSLRWSVK